MFESKIPGITKTRSATFAILFMNYAFIHCTRTTWSNVSGNLENLYKDGHHDYGFDSKYLGWINFSFLFWYGVGIMTYGQFGDRMNTKYFVLLSVFSTSFVFTLIGVLLQYGFYNENRWIFMFLQTIDGFVQAGAWPGMLAIMNRWFTEYKKVILMGCFAACANVGDILGDMYCALLIGDLEEYPIYNEQYIAQQLRNNRIAIYAAAFSLFLASCLTAIVIDPMPNDHTKVLMKEEEATLPVRKLITQSQEGTEPLNPSEMKTITVWEAYFLPGVLLYALAFGCVKAVFYALTFWLPTYLGNLKVPPNLIPWISAQTDVGSIPGGIITCLIGYYFYRRAIIIVPSLWIGTGVMLVMNAIKYNTSVPYIDSFILVFFTGFFLGGVYNNIIGAITVELSNQPALKGNTKATSTVVSAIVGYGAIFASFNQIAVSYIPDALFLYSGCLSLIAGIILMPLIVNEVKRGQDGKALEQEMQ